MTPTAGPGSHRELRATNRERLVALLRREGPMSQAELARASGLAPATVSVIVRELRAEGRVTEPDGAARGARVVLDPRAGTAVGIDFGHSHVRVAVADLAHRVLGEADEPLDVDHAADAGIARAAALVEQVLREAGVPRATVAGVGMGLPGPLVEETGEVGDSAILPGWIGARPQALMTEALAGLPVRVENDANLGALAETVWGAGRGAGDLLYVKVASGVGGGLVLGGRVFHGAAGTAGEIGHLTVDPRGPVCRCGNRGCVEAFAGADAVLEPLRRRHGEALTLAGVLRLADDGDQGARRVIADAGRALGGAVAAACNLLAPARVVVGGELAGAGDVLLDPLRGALADSAIAAVRTTPVVAGVLGERAEVLGAVALVLRESERFVAEPAALA